MNLNIINNIYLIYNYKYIYMLVAAMAPPPRDAFAYPCAISMLICIRVYAHTR